MNIYSEGQLFIFFFIIGIIIAMLYDFFRVLRKSFKTKDYVTFIEDVIFLFLSGVLIISSIIKLNYGEFRVYMCFGMFFGILIYSLTLSKLYVIIFYVLVNFVKKIILLPYNYVSKCLQIKKKKDF